MTAYTPILNLPQVATNQNQKETTINTDFAILEAAMNDALEVDTSGGDVNLTVDQYTKFFMFRAQGHATPVTLATPPASGTFTGKRFFVVSNEGTATVTVDPGGIGTGTIDVLAGKIGLIQSDGTALRAVSSGVALLTDLSDVDVTTDAPTDGQVLAYNSTAHKWVAGDFSSSNFTGLGDVPSAYTDKAKQLVRVNAAATGLEFYSFPYPVSGFFSGIPTTSQIVFQYLATAEFSLPVALTGSQFKVSVNPTATFVLDIQKGGASIGSVSFDTSSVPTVTFTSAINFAVGDVLQIVAPSTADDTAENLAFAFLATLI